MEEMNYKEIKEIVKKYKYPKIKIEKLPGFSTKAIKVS